jgi:hypothetical protein
MGYFVLGNRIPSNNILDVRQDCQETKNSFPSIDHWDDFLVGRVDARPARAEITYDFMRIFFQLAVAPHVSV